MTSNVLVQVPSPLAGFVCDLVCDQASGSLCHAMCIGTTFYSISSGVMCIMCGPAAAALMSVSRLSGALFAHRLIEAAQSAIIAKRYAGPRCRSMPHRKNPRDSIYSIN
jgi:rubredoxin